VFEKVEGIVIKSRDYGESNKILTVFTREKGKIGVMARGAKKPSNRFAALALPMTYGYFLIQKSRGLHTLYQGETISSMRSIREDIVLTAYVAYILELLDRSVEEKKPNPFLFELLYQTIHYINEGYDPEILTNIFEVKMLEVLGLYPHVHSCVSCGKKEGSFVFSLRENGILCSTCAPKDSYHLSVSPVAVKLFRLFYYLDLSRLGTISVKKETKQQLRSLIDAYYEEYSGIQLKSKKFLQQLSKLEGLS
jgi:DNA repair protein RecO (recombination protein O)